MINFDLRPFLLALGKAVVRARGARQSDYVLVNGPAGGEA